MLIAPPFYRLMGSHYNGLHLGIAYIAAVLQQRGYPVKIYNADYQDSGEYLNQRQLFDNYPIYKDLINDLSYPLWTEIKNTIAGFNPDVIGITMLTANYKAARNIGKIARDLNPNILVVTGGAHPTLAPEGTIAEPEFDYLVRGEGEFALLELLEGKDRKEIKGLSFKEGDSIVHNERREYIKDLDSLPFPCRNSFLNTSDNSDIGFVITGRGCSYTCAYCASPELWRRTVRYRSVANVMKELEYLKVNHHSSLIHFVDDTFTLNKRRAKEICQQLIDRDLGITWVCDSRVDCLDQELVSLMKKAGCIRIKIGVESGSARILKRMQKGTTLEGIRAAVKWIKEQELPLTVYLMTGFPGETNEDLRQTIHLAKELQADYYSLSVLAPYYKTQIWKDMEKAGKRLPKEHWEYFYHQSQDMILNHDLDMALLDEFFALNEKGIGKRV